MLLLLCHTRTHRINLPRGNARVPGGIKRQPNCIINNACMLHPFSFWSGINPFFAYINAFVIFPFGWVITHIGSYIIQVVIVIQPASVSSLTGLFSKDEPLKAVQLYRSTTHPSRPRIEHLLRFYEHAIATTYYYLLWPHYTFIQYQYSVYEFASYQFYIPSNLNVSVIW